MNDGQAKMLITAVRNIETTLNNLTETNKEKEKEMSEFAMVPVNNVNDLAVLGKTFEQSGMFGCTQEGQGIVLAMTCMSEKISPLKFIQTYHIIEGRPSMRADAMLAKFVERGGKFKVIEKSEKRAAIQLIKDANDQTFSMTIDQAMAEPFPWAIDKKTGEQKLKKNWSSPWMQKCMLWSRVVSDAVRTIDPGVNMGVYTPEEVQDFGDTINITAEPVEPGKSSKKASPPAMKTEKQGEKKPEAPVQAPAEAGDKEKASIDPSIIPTGKNTGKKWDILNDKALQVAATAENPAILPEHKAYVTALIAKRKEGKETQKEPEAPFPTGGKHE